jgi:hypothetical protein
MAGKLTLATYSGVDTGNTAQSGSSRPTPEVQRIMMLALNQTLSCSYIADHLPTHYYMTGTHKSPTT